jgi:hypothetical protein
VNLKLTPGDLVKLTAFLNGLQQLTQQTGVTVGAYGSADVELDGDAGKTILKVTGGAEGYFIDDTIGG